MKLVKNRSLMKFNKITKTISLFAACFMLFPVAQAQVTIGENDAPNKQAVLDLRSGTDAVKKGLLLPRVQLVAMDDPAPFLDTAENPLLEGMAVYHTGGNHLTEGIFVWNGTTWEPQGDTWFYMPSIVFDTSTPDPTGTPLTKDLFAEYIKQFQTDAIGSDGAPGLIFQVPQRDEYYYYIVGYDDLVFEIVGISADGILSYRVLQNATDATYINVVFVRK